MEFITVKNIAQSCSDLLQNYKGRPEKGKIFLNIFFAKSFVAKVLICTVIWKSNSGDIHEVGFRDYYHLRYPNRATINLFHCVGESLDMQLKTLARFGGAYHRKPMQRNWVRFIVEFEIEFFKIRPKIWCCCENVKRRRKQKL